MFQLDNTSSDLILGKIEALRLKLLEYDRFVKRKLKVDDTTFNDMLRHITLMLNKRNEIESTSPMDIEAYLWNLNSLLGSNLIDELKIESLEGGTMAQLFRTQLLFEKLFSFDASLAALQPYHAINERYNGFFGVVLDYFFNDPELKPILISRLSELRDYYVNYFNGSEPYFLGLGEESQVRRKEHYLKCCEVLKDFDFEKHIDGFYR